jgi:exonuclease III
MGNYTRVDNVFTSTDIAHRVMECRVIEEERPPKTDHFPILTVVSMKVEAATEKVR